MTPTEIRTLRRSLGLTQSQLGRLLGLSGAGTGRTVRSWEAGYRVPSGPVVRLLWLLRHAEIGGERPLYLAIEKMFAKAGVTSKHQVTW